MQNGLIGLHVDGGAAVPNWKTLPLKTIFRPTNRGNDSGGSGVVVSRGSTVMLRGGRISGNGGRAGLMITSGSNVVATGLTVENNDVQGIGVYRNSLLDANNDSLVTGTGG